MSNTGKTTTTRPAATQDHDQDQEVAEVQHPCGVCPMRSIAQNETYGYDEGCTRVTRRCRGCDQQKPQVGWGWGFLWGGLAAFLCADCRIPAEPNVEVTHPRFTAPLTFENDGQRYAVAEALSAGAAQANSGSGSPVAASVLSRMAECLRSSAGPIDIDLSDVPMQSRRIVLERLSLIRDYARDPRDARLLRTMVWVWSAFVEDSGPPPPAPAPRPTVAEVSRRVNGEIWI